MESGYCNTSQWLILENKWDIGTERKDSFFEQEENGGTMARGGSHGGVLPCS